MGTWNTTLLATGAVFLAGGVLYATVPAAAGQTAQTASISLDAMRGEPYPALPKATRSSPLDSVLDAIAAEVDYSGRRLTRIANTARASVRGVLSGAPAAPQSRAESRPASSASPAGGAERPPRGPSDAALGDLTERTYALRTPPVSAWPERPLREEAAKPPVPTEPAASDASKGGDGSATGARRLLRRLEDQGDMTPRRKDWEQSRFAAAVPPAQLDSRFDAWSGKKASTGEDVYGFSSKCLDGEQLPGGSIQHVSTRGSGGGTARAVAAKKAYGGATASQPGRSESGVARLTAILPDSPQRMADGSVFLPKLTQRLLNVRTAQACVDETPRIEQLIGKVISNPNASGLVQAGQVGRIRPGPHGLPEIGMRVREGQPLGVLMPSLTTIERGQLESQLAELRSEIILNELSLARMRDFPIVPFRTGRMLALRLELDGLRKRRDMLIAGVDNHEMLLSPMDGVISRADIVSGQLVHAGDTLWQVVDPRRMRIEAIAFDEAVAREIGGAWALTSENEVIRLSFIGRSMSLMNQGIPLHFEIRDHAEGLSVGTPVSVYVSARGGGPAIILPKSALVRDDAGRTVVWEHIEGERFMPRSVHAEPLNGWQVVVRDGIPDNARIIHIGASHLSQIR